jgi:hypothetical protein
MENRPKSYKEKSIEAMKGYNKSCKRALDYIDTTKNQYGEMFFGWVASTSSLAPPLPPNTLPATDSSIVFGANGLRTITLTSLVNAFPFSLGTLFSLSVVPSPNTFRLKLTAATGVTDFSIGFTSVNEGMSTTYFGIYNDPNVQYFGGTTGLFLRSNSGGQSVIGKFNGDNSYSTDTSQSSPLAFTYSNGFEIAFGQSVLGGPFSVYYNQQLITSITGPYANVMNGISPLYVSIFLNVGAQITISIV